MSRYEPWRSRLAAIDDAGLTRSLSSLKMVSPTRGQLNTQDVIVACSNDYLGLAFHPELCGAAKGVGAGASRLISGSRPIHHQLEDALEEAYGRPALLFVSGYQANLAVFSSVCEAGQHIASDALNHASIIDGIRLSPSECVVVPHGEPDAIPNGTDLIVVEGLYSMNGDRAPLDQYPKEPWLAVDEAHALGCLGPRGLGRAAEVGVEPDILVGTFGKALGAAGAFVVGPPELKELLINTGRSFIYTTAAPEPLVAMALAGFKLALGADDLRERLVQNTVYFRQGLAQLGWQALGSAHIVPVMAGKQVMDLSARLEKRGVLAPGIRYPTVAKGEERIRFTLSAAHTTVELDQILDALGAKPSG